MCSSTSYVSVLQESDDHITLLNPKSNKRLTPRPLIRVQVSDDNISCSIVFIDGKSTFAGYAHFSLLFFFSFLLFFFVCSIVLNVNPKPRFPEP